MQVQTDVSAQVQTCTKSPFVPQPERCRQQAIKMDRCLSVSEFRSIRMLTA
ncbi:hypothetical protein [Syntrophotalea acetylenica]|uniref:hypothetical protein n=1 Tax=Syntrophotalea acetylenica TaxID=29542 RepID=UPI002A36FFE3|nr:hypothetical protein [Syntrophotalea acetylenica]MDY0263541.1 hypothetical protein [Syntrophotalea acetylenica]